MREIKRFLEEQYKVEVSTDLISTVMIRSGGCHRVAEPAWSRCTGGVLRRFESQNRDEGTVKNKAVYLALGIQRDGTKDVLGIWIQQSEGASSGSGS